MLPSLTNSPNGFRRLAESTVLQVRIRACKTGIGYLYPFCLCSAILAQNPHPEWLI